MNVKTIERHDYLSVKISEAKDRNLTLTINRNGEKASGRGIDLPMLKRALVAFAKASKPDVSNSAYIRQVAAMAEGAEDMAAFIELMETA